MRSFYRFQVRSDPYTWDRFCRLESLRFEKTVGNLRVCSQAFPKNLVIYYVLLLGKVEYSCAVSCIPVFNIGISLATLSRSVICCALDMSGVKVAIELNEKTLSYSKPYALHNKN
jgi:hypothetical protein